MKLQISLHEECNVSGIDPDKIEVNSQLARKYSSSISTAKKMSAQEISAFLNDAESNWESEDVIAITNEVEEGSKLNSLPRF
ncbi:hypothetical protein [Deefgea sp. CFH1-16]|uniref:hypothetical protein n=1 Tax=Deefgea sp. CFH1-16 TaxID=2675457 RepID=UPI0015F6F223|nr:hypothetical protein [Deefgea sp. CFH1-16]MBM5573662.1 hypothetical protein [Deefgea sp. CFH1-16]